MVPRIAVLQAPFLRDTRQALERTLRYMRQAASRGADILVAGEWFLGLNPVDVVPNRITAQLQVAARDLNLMVVAGGIRVLDPDTGQKQQRALVIDRDGTLLGHQAKIRFQPLEQPWFEPGEAITAITTRWGRVAILLGLDAIDRDRWEEAKEAEPSLVVMAAGARSAHERIELQELAVARSQILDTTVVLAPIMGRFSGQTYVAAALIAEKGHILSLGDREGLVVAGDPDTPLIQLGVTDAAAHPPRPGARESLPVDPLKALGSEAERRALVDWAALTNPDVLAASRELLAQAGDNGRMVALVPARPGHAHELEVALGQGAAGAFFYPGLDGLMPWAEEVLELGRILASHRRPALIHTGPGPAPLRYDRPLMWDEFLSADPDLTVILAQMGGRSPLTEEALMLAARHPRVYLETCSAPLGAIREAISEFGPERVVLGSGGLPEQFQREWQKLSSLEAQLGPDAFQAIVNRNARRLLFRSHDGAKANPGGLTVIR